jgi:chemosensory pili system protein ChpA (sensor histidine kinase/response regulator)
VAVLPPPPPPRGTRDTGNHPALRTGRDTGGQAALRPATNTGQMNAVSAPHRVLVVDDSRSVRETVSRVLAGAGYIVDTAIDGQEAWDMLKDVEYDLMVTDLEMPRLDGYQLLERVRDNPTTKHMPVLIISSRATEAHRARATALGASGFLAKPLARPALVESVGGLLR